MNKHDRRTYFRVREILEIRLILRESDTRKKKIFTGTAIDIGLAGLSVSTDHTLPRIDKGIIEISLPDPLEPVQARIKFKWGNDEKQQYGIEFIHSVDNQLGGWEKFIRSSNSSIPDRRGKEKNRRLSEEKPAEPVSDKNNRKMIRRITDLWHMEANNGKSADLRKTDLVPKRKDIDYTVAAAKARREWLSAKTGVEFNHIGVFSENPKNLQGNIENFIGITQVPIGVAGPLKINGQFAKGDFYIPLATTEGALVYTYSIGMQILHMSGGVTTRIIKDETHISPLFTFNTLNQAHQFCYWLQANFELIKKHAEATTRYGKLLKIEPIIYDKNITVKFCYSTGDAMGLNMINFATEAACKFIVPIVKPKRFYMRSNFSSIKKISAHNFSFGIGKSVICEAIVPNKIVKRIFEITPKDITTYFHTAMLSSVNAGMIGMNGHVANGLTALFIACGQDVANVVDSHVGVSNFEETDGGDLYLSLKLPNLFVGTVGGGAELASQRECLELIDCYGNGKVEKFSEIAAATSLAGELAVCANVANGKFVNAHRTYGRKQKRPIK
ncbi:MAG: hypothetical protein MCM46_18870 [Candidatus Manganitrophus sp. SB1]|nr:hypothetical protein [Candidatus Manganitrophus morganii]